MRSNPTARLAHFKPWPALATWALGAVALVWLDGQVDLANLAMLVVLTSVVASLWLPAWASVLAGGVGVMAFNVAFVPPRGSWRVDLHQHAVLLLAMAAVSAVVSVLMARQRRQALHALALAERAEQLRRWGDTLRDTDDPWAHAGGLQQRLEEACGGTVSLLLVNPHHTTATAEAPATQALGEVNEEQRAGLDFCIRQGQAMGPHTGRHQELPDWYVPLRARNATLGAALLQVSAAQAQDLELLAHAQALCDQLGGAMQRAQAAAQTRAAREQAQTQAVRNALLAAISHDYRTPLATIMGAASSLDEQADRLNADQRRKLAQRIVDETAQLSRLTDNTLQLARLDAPGVQLRCDWESPEEIVGAALRHARARDPERRVRARLQPELPLLWCDAMLISQMLDNLVDNALKYSAGDSPIEILIKTQDTHMLLAVRDRGPGVAPAWRERIFDVFHRGAEPASGPRAATGTTHIDLPKHHVDAARGAGVGLAVCRAIAQAHGGQLSLRARGHGGSAFECRLPLREAPAPPPPASPA